MSGPAGENRPSGDQDPRAPRPQPRTLLMAALVGGVSTGGAYVVSGGSIPVFVAVMVAFGILVRVGARALMKRQGRRPPRGWWL
jgi:hypothetical protein